MLTLQELFDDLAVGVLSNLALVDNTTKALKTSSYPAVVSYINLALTALHKRFLIRTGELVVKQDYRLTTYPLRSEFAESNVSSLAPVKYIKDSELYPFKNDIIKIEQVFSELGEEYPINDSKQKYPIYTPEYDVLSMLPTSNDAQTVFVIYRAKHPKILITNPFVPANINVKLPDTFLDALYSRIAAYAYKRVVAEDSEVSSGRSYMFQYELECKRLEDENVVSNDNETSTTFGDKGWV
jgi:hypothetical protein